MLSTAALPQSVRYVKNGLKGRWWPSAHARNEIHLGWSAVPGDAIVAADLERIRQVVKGAYGHGFGELRTALDHPSQHLWITFQDGYLWWSTVLDGATVNPAGENESGGHFWLTCDRPWSNRSVGGRLLAISDLPGSVTSVAGYRSTICTPRGSDAARRIIYDQVDPDATAAAEARQNYEAAVLKMVRRLSPKDFEQLVDLILAGTGWARISSLGGTREGIDLEAENAAANEIAFVQVKSAATQAVLDDYIRRFEMQRERYARMIFAVHSPSGALTSTQGGTVQIWAGEKVAHLVVRLGLGQWVETRIA